jgi:hypothetical protein
MLWRAVAIATLSLAACAPGCAQENPSAQDMPAPAAPPRPQKAQVPRGTVSGTVYCADTNQPARLAHISLEPVTKDGNVGRSYRADTDLEGRFTVGNLPEGKYYVAGELLGYVNPLAQWHDFARKAQSDEERKALEARLTTVYVTAREAGVVGLRLERGAEIDGTVLYDDGSPAVGVHVALKPKTAQTAAGNESVPVVVEYMEYAERTTDDRGRFRLLGVAPGEYTVSAELSSASAEQEQNMFVTMVQSSQLGNLAVYYGDTLRASKAKTIKIAGGEAKDADITIPLSKLHTIRGRVVVKSTGEAPPTAAVRLLCADTREVARTAMAVEGEFEFGYVADDSYVLQAAASAEPLPKIDVEDDDGGGFFVSSSSGSIQLEVGAGKEKGGEVAVLVHGDVSGVVIETPDPPTQQPGTETTEAPAQTEATPVGPPATPVTPQ